MSEPGREDARAVGEEYALWVERERQAAVNPPSGVNTWFTCATTLSIPDRAAGAPHHAATKCRCQKQQNHTVHHVARSHRD